MLLFRRVKDWDLMAAMSVLSWCIRINQMICIILQATWIISEDLSLWSLSDWTAALSISKTCDHPLAVIASSLPFPPSPTCRVVSPGLKTHLPLTGMPVIPVPRVSDSRFAPSQWETSLQSNAVSHWLGAKLESALCCEFRGRRGRCLTKQRRQ